MERFKILPLLSLLCAVISLSGQNNFTDSVFNAVRSCSTDTCKLNRYVSFIENSILSNTKASSGLIADAEKIISKLKSQNVSEQTRKYILKHELTLAHCKGVIFSVGGKFDSSLVYYNNAMNIAIQLNDKKQEAGALSDISEVKRKTGNYPEALDFALKALKIKETIGDSAGISMSYNNIGMIFRLKKEFDKSEEFQLKAIALKKRLMDRDPSAGNRSNLAYSYSNLANVYYQTNKIKEAIRFCTMAIDLYRQSNNIHALSGALSNIGVMYENAGNKEAALKSYLEALKHKEQIGNKEDLATTYINLGAFYSETDLDKGEEYILKGYRLAKETGFKEFEKEAARALADLYSLKNNYKKAYEYHLIYSDLHDSILDVTSHEQITEMQTRYETEKKEKENLELRDKNRIQELESANKDIEIKKQRTVIIFVVTGILLTGILALYIFKSYREKKKANDIILRQKEEVEKQKAIVEHQKETILEKQHEILDSINYAKRLQNAILATPEEIEKFLPESFLLYKPKDIVAGDFYFFETINEHIIIAAADCTGHGIPGAIVSVVCSNALSRCVKEFNLTEPGAILTRARELVVETFKKSGQDVKDGMDISLCSINRNTRELLWSGANNPLWYINEGDKEISEIKSDKQPIGLTDLPRPFTTHTVNIPNGIVYLFTDGYADQFGGPKGKKFKYKQFAEVLSANSNLPMKEQAKLLDDAFNAWRGNLEQVDDVCVIGIKLQ